MFAFSRGQSRTLSESETDAGIQLPLSLEVAAKISCKVCIELAVSAKAILSAQYQFCPGVFSIKGGGFPSSVFGKVAGVDVSILNSCAR